MYPAPVIRSPGLKPGTKPRWDPFWERGHCTGSQVVTVSCAPKNVVANSILPSKLSKSDADSSSDPTKNWITLAFFHIWSYNIIYTKYIHFWSFLYIPVSQFLISSPIPKAWRQVDQFLQLISQAVGTMGSSVLPKYLGRGGEGRTSAYWWQRWGKSWSNMIKGEALTLFKKLLSLSFEATSGHLLCMPLEDTLQKAAASWTCRRKSVMGCNVFTFHWNSDG